MSASEIGVRHRPGKAPQDPEVHRRAEEHSKKQPESKTLTYEQSLVQVPWQTDNKYIRTGYRRRLFKFGDVAWSLVGCEYSYGLW